MKRFTVWLSRNADGVITLVLSIAISIIALVHILGTEEINAAWPTIPAHRFAEVDKAFGQWDNSGINTILYGIDNEIHHRGQGYVYLRALGIEPPHFWER